MICKLPASPVHMLFSYILFISPDGLTNFTTKQFSAFWFSYIFLCFLLLLSANTTSNKFSSFLSLILTCLWAKFTITPNQLTGFGIKIFTTNFTFNIWHMYCHCIVKQHDCQSLLTINNRTPGGNRTLITSLEGWCSIHWTMGA